MKVRNLFSKFLPFWRSAPTPAPDPRVADAPIVIEALAAAPAAAQSSPSPIPSPSFEVTGHFQGLGDRRALADGWAGRASGANRIEGFRIDCTTPGWRELVTIQAVQADRSLTEPVHGGGFCGTRGKMTPIYGFVLHVPAEAAQFSAIFYQGVFQDGFRSGLLRPGGLCVSPRHTALLALRITTDPNASHSPANEPEPAAADATKGASLQSHASSPSKTRANRSFWDEPASDISPAAHGAGKGDTPAGKDGGADNPEGSKNMDGYSAT